MQVKFLRAFSESVAFALMFLVWEVNVKCISAVMLRMVGVLFSESDCPFKVTGECKMDSYLSRVKRRIEDFIGDAHILLLVSHYFHCVMK